MGGTSFNFYTSIITFDSKGGNLVVVVTAHAEINLKP